MALGQQDEGIKLRELLIPLDRPGQDSLIPPLRTEVLVLARGEAGAELRVLVWSEAGGATNPDNLPFAPRSRTTISGSCSPGGTRHRSAGDGRGRGAAPSQLGWEEAGRLMPAWGAVTSCLGHAGPWDSPCHQPATCREGSKPPLARRGDKCHRASPCPCSDGTTAPASVSGSSRLDGDSLEAGAKPDPSPGRPSLFLGSSTAPSVRAVTKTPKVEQRTTSSQHRTATGGTALTPQRVPREAPSTRPGTDHPANGPYRARPT